MTPRLPALRYGPAWSARPLQLVAPSDSAAWGGAGAAIVGLVVLLGWLLGIDALKTMFAGLQEMKPNSAICFVLLGLGIVLLSRARLAPLGRSVAFASVVVATVIALVTGAQYVTGVDLGIDDLLFHQHAVVAGVLAPGRMSPLTAICFTLLGLAALASASARARRTVIAISGVALAVSLMNVFDFAFDAAVPPFLAGYSQMAVHTAVAMGILGLGVLGLLGPANPFAELARGSPTALLLRRLLAVSVAVPILMAWLALEGQRLGIFDTSFGTSLMIVGILMLGIIAILRAARWANELETKRQALEVERDRFFELSLDMLSVVGADGRFRRTNGAWESALGYHAAELIGRPFLDFVHPDDLERTIVQTQRHYGQGEPVEAFQNRYRHRDGTYRWLEWMSQVAPDGSVAFAVARDVTDRKRGEDRRARQQRLLESRNEALNERAVRDPLTGLHNRRYFDAAVVRLERRWRRLPADQTMVVSLVIFDLDHFGQVNKLHGHQAGDTVLRVFAGLLQKRFRESDLIARYGGEEFVVILEGVSSSRATLIADDIRVAFEGTPIDIGNDTPIRVTVSGGCAELGDDRSVSAALAVADVWLSQAKRAGRNQVVGL